MATNKFSTFMQYCSTVPLFVIK